MSASELIHKMQELFSLSLETSNETLRETFDRCLKLHDAIDTSELSSTDEIFQDAINKTIQCLENCTLQVNQLNMFSCNENIDEVATSDMRYLLLPALLGNLKQKINTKDFSGRLENLQAAALYFKDFLKRCKCYEVNNVQIPDEMPEVFENEDSEFKKPLDAKSIAVLSAEREKKIESYKKIKKLKEREKELNIYLDKPHVDEQNIREYFLTLLEKWIYIALEDLESIKKEIALLKPMLQISDKPVKKESKETKPLKPMIITRNEIQKKVFGMGYPSLPIMTINDFYQQKFERIVEENKANKEQSLQEMAFTGNFSQKEKEIEKEELLIERDDPQTLQKARNWDDWKDDNPRGSGNRKNKG